MYTSRRRKLSEQNRFAALLFALVFWISGCTGLVSSTPNVSQPSQAPNISGVTPSQISSTGATISWVTDQASNSQVDYGTTANYGASSVLNSALVTTHSVAISGLTPATLYHYRVKSGNAAGLLTTSADFTFTTANGPDTTPPTVSITSPISGATVSGTITVAATASDNVGVSGVQFQVDGVNTGAVVTASPYIFSLDTTKLTNGTHSLTAVASDAAGNHTTSSAVLVTVSNATLPTITTQPANQSVTAGQTATFSVAATGTAPLTYQWSKNGASITGATSSNYTTPATTSADNGSTFQVKVSNAAGTTPSNTVTLTVNPAPVAPTITTQPTNQSVTAGQTATFSVTATGTAPLSYQWSKNGANISGATSSSYTTQATTSADNGSTFQVTVSNAVSTTPSATATLTVTPSGGSAQAQLVQHVSSSNTRNNGFSSPYCYHFQLPNLTTAGNTLVVGFTFNNNPTPSVTDDQGDSYSVQVNHYDSADTQSIGIATAFNIAAGARVISVCFNSDPGGDVQPMATEFDNVVGIDATGTGSQGSGTTVTAGSMTPTVTGDLVYQVAFSLSVNQSSFTAGSQTNISWSLLSADLLDGWAGQYGLYNSTAAINPTLSMGTSQKWISAALLLKTGTSGGVPSGMRVVHLVHENIPEHTSAGGTGNPFPNPTSLQFPSSGNLLVAMIGGGNNSAKVTSMTDTNSNTWKQAGTTQVISGNDTALAYYAGNAATSGNLTLTLNWSATDGDFTAFLYDVAAAAASPLDTTAGGTGSQSNAGSLTVSFTITPATAGELVFTEIIWDFNTGAGLAGSGWFFDTNTFSGENQSGPEPVDQNNGWGHYFTTGNSPVSITWQVMYSGLPVGNWAGIAVAFKP